MAIDSIGTRGSPYTVTWYEEGVKKSMRRVPPPRLHEALPTDIVELTTRRSDDFKEDKEYEVKAINPRHPNVLQLVNKDGDTTFVGYQQTILKDKVADREGVPRSESKTATRYLTWP